MSNLCCVMLFFFVCLFSENKWKELYFSNTFNASCGSGTLKYSSLFQTELVLLTILGNTNTSHFNLSFVKSHL